MWRDVDVDGSVVVVGWDMTGMGTGMGADVVRSVLMRVVVVVVDDEEVWERLLFVLGVAA